MWVVEIDNCGIFHCVEFSVSTEWVSSQTNEGLCLWTAMAVLWLCHSHSANYYLARPTNYSLPTSSVAIAWMCMHCPDHYPLWITKLQIKSTMSPPSNHSMETQTSWYVAMAASASCTLTSPKGNRHYDVSKFNGALRSKAWVVKEMSWYLHKV